MKTILAVSCAFVGMLAAATSANAADAAPAAYDWNGFYAGVNAGLALNSSNIDQDQFYYGDHADQFEDQLTSNQSTFTGGVMLGYNWQMDSIILGVETDINYLGFSDKKNDTRDFTAPNGDDVTASSTLSFNANWYGTLRGRLGYAIDNVLLYGTGGLAYGHMEANSKLDIDGPLGNVSYEGSTSNTNFGWTIGAGLEYGVDRWTLGAEYLFVDLGSAEWDGDFTNQLDGTDAEGAVDYQFSVVRATAKLRF